MKFLAQTITWIKPHYKHLALLFLLLLSLPSGTTQATSLDKDQYDTKKSKKIIEELEKQKSSDEPIIHNLHKEKSPNEKIIEDLEEQKSPDEPPTDEPSFDIEKIKYFIKTAIEKVENPETLKKLENNEMVYFYGNTGAGKSTIINYLLGNELEKYYPEDEENLNTNEQPIDDTMNTNTQSEENYIYGGDSTDSSEEEERIFKIRLNNPNAIGPKIGNNAVQAETTYPCPYFPQGNNHPLGYCDTAGFSDTRGIENILCSYIGNNLIIQKSNKLKAICFLTTKEALSVSKGQPFLNSVIATISNLIEKTEECNPLDSIFVVLNNKSQIKNKKLSKQVFQMLDNFMKGFKESTQQEQQNAQKYGTYINILQKILKDSSNKETKRILAINPLDDGTSRKDFLKRISTSPIIPNENLKRLASKQGEQTVKYLQEKILQEAEPILDRILALRKTIHEKAKKASELDTKIQNLKDKKEKFVNTIEDLGNRFKQIEKQQENLHQKIVNIQKSQEELKKQIAKLELEKITFDDTKETEKLLSQYDYVIKNQKEQISKLENKQNVINAEIKRLKHKIECIKDEQEKLAPQIENETKQIQKLKNEETIFLQNITQDKIIELAKEEKSWFDYYQEFLGPVSNDWAKNKLEQKVFDLLRRHIYNALKACNCSCLTLTEPSYSFANSVNFNPSGTLLALGASDNTIKIWDTSKWRCIKSLEGHLKIVNSVNFNPSDTLLASASSDKTIKIWDTSSWRCKKTLEQHLNSVNSVHFNSSGTLLASGSSDKAIKIWDSSSWRCIKTLKQHANVVLSVHFNPSGTLLASGSSDKTIGIWNTSNWRCIKILKNYPNTAVVNSVYFNESGTLLASSNGNTVAIWDTGSWDCIKTLQGHLNTILSVNFNPSGTLLASGSEDKTIKIWDRTSNDKKNNRRFWESPDFSKKTLKKHSDVVLSVNFNPSGTLLASASADRNIKIWDVKNMLDSNKSNYSLLDKGKFKHQTDKHLKKIKEIINHYYKGKIKELTESSAQKKAKKLKDNIISFTNKLSEEKEKKLDGQKKINEGYNKINTLDTKKLEKIEEQIKKKKTNHKTQQSLAKLIQEKKDVDTTIYNLQKSQIQKKENFHNIELQLTQAKSKKESLLESISSKQEIFQETSHELEDQKNELAEDKGKLQSKQPGIELVLKIDSIVPMGLVLLSRFIKKYNQCTINTKHTDNKF